MLAIDDPPSLVWEVWGATTNPALGNDASHTKGIDIIGFLDFTTGELLSTAAADTDTTSVS